MKLLIILAAACCVGYTAKAQNLDLVSPDAKITGMGGVSMTVFGSHAIFDNSAATAFSLNQGQVAASFYGNDEFNYAVSGFFRFNNNNVLQAGWRLSGANEQAVDVGYSRRLGKNFAIGAVGRYYRQKNVETKSTQALAIDLSAMYVLPLDNTIGYSNRFIAGAKIKNIGGYLNNDYGRKLPMTASLGVAMDTNWTETHEVTIGVDVDYVFRGGLNNGVQASVGAEYNYAKLFQLRGGYHYGANYSYAAVGCGFEILFMNLDFTYTFSKADVGDMIMFSFGVWF